MGPREYPKEIKPFIEQRRMYIDSIDSETLMEFKRGVVEIKRNDENVIKDNTAMLETLHPDVAKAYKKNVKAPNITLDMTSPGGSVYVGLAMYDIIESQNRNARSTGAEIVVETSGFVASMGTIVMLACKHRAAHKNTRFMIHSVAGYIGYEKVEQSKEDIEEMEKVQGIIENIYLEKTRIPKSLLNEIRSCKKDYWIDAVQALEYGLITEIIN